jgi:prophage regulatory protein
MNQTMKPRRLIRIYDVMDLTGMSRSTIYAKMKEGQFPRPLKISHRHVAWDADDIFNWIGDLPEAQFQYLRKKKHSK